MEQPRKEQIMLRESMSCEEYVAAIAINNNNPDWLAENAGGLSVDAIVRNDSYCIQWYDEPHVLVEPYGELVQITDPENITVDYAV